MQYKVLMNIIHKGTPHFIGDIVDLIGADIERLLHSGHISEDVTQNPAALTPENKVEEKSQPQQAAKDEQTPAEAKTDTSTDTTESHADSAHQEAPEVPQKSTLEDISIEAKK